MNRELRYTLCGSVLIALALTVMVVLLVLFTGMPVWGAVAVELSAQTGWWAAYLLVRRIDA